MLCSGHLPRGFPHTEPSAGRGLRARGSARSSRSSLGVACDRGRTYPVHKKEARHVDVQMLLRTPASPTAQAQSVCVWSDTRGDRLTGRASLKAAASLCLSSLDSYERSQVDGTWSATSQNFCPKTVLLVRRGCLAAPRRSSSVGWVTLSGRLPLPRRRRHSATGGRWGQPSGWA